MMGQFRKRLLASAERAARHAAAGSSAGAASEAAVRG